MKRNILNFILTIFLALILSEFLPWWSIMVASFATGLFITLKRSSVFFVPFLAIAVFWIIYSYILSSGNNFILAKKIAVLLPLNGNAYLLMLVTGIVGGIAAGISAIFGKQCALLLARK
ncbi:MAG TPA: hypothetical protein VKN14_08855 [Flavobacteriaceae bacterium]|nr:hypothetical protein [Flavobacteriaceae bacterium]